LSGNDFFEIENSSNLSLIFFLIYAREIARLEVQAVAVKKPQKALEKAGVAGSGLRPAHKGPPNSRPIKKTAAALRNKPPVDTVQTLNVA
jgi:hypothetical protein